MNKKIMALLSLIIIGTAYFIIYTNIEKTENLEAIFTVATTLLTTISSIVLIEVVMEIVAPKLYSDESTLINRAKNEANSSALVLIAKSIRLLAYALIAFAAIVITK